MDVNYFGALHCAHAVLKKMKERGSGRVVLVSSVAGQIGLYGMGGYVASKFALRGLGEALVMECNPYNIKVSVVFPPDTDTPGLAKENENKPEITKILGESGGLWDPEVVASGSINGVEEGRHHIYFGLEGSAVALVSSGMSQASSVGEMLLRSVSMGVLAIVAQGWNLYCAHLCSSTLKKE